MTKAALALALLLGTAACRPVGPADAPARGGLVRSELYFGRATPAGAVSDAQWKTFLEGAVVPRLPGGFTVLDGEGAWRGSDGRTRRERSKVLVVLHDGGPSSVRALEELRSLYKARFRQESVLRVDAPARAFF